MDAKPHVVFYTKPGCHLCEDALREIARAACAGQFTFEEVNILDDPELHRRYAAEIPVAGHIGLTPQSVNRMGGFKVQGKSLSEIEELMHDATALDRAGVACLFLEGIPREALTSVCQKL